MMLIMEENTSLSGVLENHNIIDKLLVDNDATDDRTICKNCGIS